MAIVDIIPPKKLQPSHFQASFLWWSTKICPGRHFLIHSCCSWKECLQSTIFVSSQVPVVLFLLIRVLVLELDWSGWVVVFLVILVVSAVVVFLIASVTEFILIVVVELYEKEKTCQFYRYRISSNKTRGYYFFAGPSTAGIIRGLVLFSRCVNFEN